VAGLPTIDAPCFLCGALESEPVWSTRDRALAVPGRYWVVRCLACGFLYQRPRVRDDHLAECYPDHYPRHQEPAPRIPFKGSAARVTAVRRALATGLGYTAFQDARASLLTRVRARLLERRLRWDCPPWRDGGRYLDVGCGSGGALGVAGALGWLVVAGIEVDRDAAAKARRFSEQLHAGDVLSAPFGASSFDVITAFHVLEHVPDPVAVVRRMLGWLAPGGLAIVEVPNAGGLGASLFGSAWSGLELPRHLCQFTPESLRRAVEEAGGRVIWCWHQAKPRYYLWSLDHWLRDRGWDRLARAAAWRPVHGVLKLFLEVALPFCRWARRGEVIRIGVVTSSRCEWGSRSVAAPAVDDIAQRPPR
jgi:SAM-dependent methyltransferase